jgi:diacylglycerol O-acyltransferase / wax synthase
VMHGLGLNITIQTYAGSVDFGIIAGKNALPHAQDLAKALVAAFEEARSLYAIGQKQNIAVSSAVKTPAPSVKTPVPRATKKQATPSKAAVVKASTLEPKRVTTPRQRAAPAKTKAK